MSFYVGKYNGKIQCHITKGVHSIGVMRSEPSTPTIFHTDIKYIDYKIEMLGSSDGSVSYYTRTAYYYYMSTAIKKYIAAGYSFFIYDFSTQRYMYEGILIESSSWRSISDIVQLADYLTNVTHRAYEDINTQKVYCKKNSSNIGFVFYGVDINGYKKDLFSQDRSGEIKIKKDMFNVGGYDLLRFPYLNPNKINEIDQQIKSSDGTFVMQLINSAAKGSGMNLKSKVGETTITLGGHVVLTTNAASSLVEFGNRIYTYSMPKYSLTVSGGQHKKIYHKCSDTILNNGDMFCIGLYESGIPSMRVLRFKSGDIQIMEQYTLGEESDPGYYHKITVYGSLSKVYVRIEAYQRAGTGGTSYYTSTARRVNINILK